MLEYIASLSDKFTFIVILPHEGNMRKYVNELNAEVKIIHQYNWAVEKAPSILKIVKIIARTIFALYKTVQLINREKADYFFTNTQIPFIGCFAAKLSRIPHVWWFHEFGEEDFGFKIGFGRVRTAFKIISNTGSLIICNSDAMKRKFSALLPKVKMIRIYYPIFWNRNICSDIVRKAKYVVFGQVAPAKAHKDVIDAFGQALQCGLNFNEKLFIIGPCEDQNYLNQLHNLIRSYNASSNIVIETGFLQKEKVLPQFEVLIVASYAEAFGRVIVEAQKAGLKTVVRNSGGAPELVNETNGLLFKNVQELTRIIAGEVPLPKGPNRLSYDENEEIEKLKGCLEKL
jgi:glycosyltransferase involved in cell wall biosynthesis